MIFEKYEIKKDLPIHETEIGVEQEEVRGTGGAKCLSDDLGFVEQVGEVLHGGTAGFGDVMRAILRVIICVVGRDGDHADVARVQMLREQIKLWDNELYKGAVVG